MDINAVEIKAGISAVNLCAGESITVTEMITIDGETVVARERGPAYIERDGVLEVYPDWAK